MAANDTLWKSYEEVARYLLDQFANEFGLERVEGKQSLAGKATEWEIDAKGVCQEDEGFIVVECRRYTSAKQTQEKVSSLAYRILDLGAKGGIIVSPTGLQKGAQRIAAVENIISVQMAPNSTTTDYVLSFLNRTMAGIGMRVTVAMTATCEIKRPCRSCGQKFTPNDNEYICEQCTAAAP